MMGVNDEPPFAAGSAGRWRIAWLLALGVIINYLDRVNLSVCQPALHAEYGLSPHGYGWLLGAYSWTYALLQLPVGVLIDRLGVQRIGRWSTALWSVASFATAGAPSVSGLFAARLLLGIGEAPTFPANAKAIGRWFTLPERGRATALFDAAAKLGPGLGAPLAGWVLLTLGWRASFLVSGLVSALYCTLFFRVYREPPSAPVADEARPPAAPEGPADSTGVSLTYLLRQRKVLGLSIGFAAYNYTFYLLLTWLPSYLGTALGLDVLHSALYTSVPFVVAAASDYIVGGWLVDALVRRGWNSSRVRRVILLTGTALGTGIFGAARASSAGEALFWISVSIGGLAATAPVGWSIPALIAPPAGVGRTGGIMNFFSQLAAIAAPILTGYVVERSHSFYAAFAVAAAVLLFGLLAYAVLLGRIERLDLPQAPAGATPPQAPLSR